MSTELAKKPASVVRAYTQQVRDHTAAMQRAQDQYFAALKRAESQYFDSVKRITDALTAGDPPIENNDAAPTAEAQAPN